MSRRFAFLIAVVALLPVVPLGGRQFISQVSPAPRDPSLGNTRYMAIGTAIVTGTVTAADGGEPIAGARVSIGGTATAAVSQPGGGTTSVSRNTITDPQGRFSIDALPAGQFTLTVTHDLFLATGYGQKTTNRPAPPFLLLDGQRLNAPMRLLRGGIITGTIFGPNGERLVRAQVRVARYQWTNGVRRPANTYSASTDDRGTYRAFGLPPGDYVVSALPTSQWQATDQVAAENALFRDALAAARAAAARSGSGPPTRVAIPVPGQVPGNLGGAPPGPAPIYFPSSMSFRNAAILPVKAGEELSGIDVRVEFVRTSHIVGSVVGTIPPQTNVQLSLINQDSAGEMGMMSAQATPDGQFAFRSVVPGEYIVMAQTTPAPRPAPVAATGQIPQYEPPRLEDAQRLWGRTTVTVDGTFALPAVLTLQPGRTISGIVISEMAGPMSSTGPAPMVTLAVAATAQQQPQFGPLPTARLEPDGRFSFSGVFPGRYTFRVNRGTTKSAIVNGEDVLDMPLNFTGDQDVSGAVITITDKTSQLGGVFATGAGAPIVDAWIVLFAADRRYWTPGSRRILLSRPDATGKYTFRNMPAGEYLLTAADFENGAQYDPELLRSLASRADRVTIAEGAQVVRDIRGGP